MSAKDLRKSIALELHPRLAQRVRGYAAHYGDRSLSGACRRAIRAYFLNETAPKTALAPASQPPYSRPLRLRLQLEPQLLSRFERRKDSAVEIHALLEAFFGTKIDEA